MFLYRIDPLHPDRLRCERCGQTVAHLPEGGEAPDGSLTAEQAARAWPELAGAVAKHDALCRAAAAAVQALLLGA